LIILPDIYAPRVVGYEPLAGGFDVRTSRGALAGRVVTPGGRFAITVEFPTMTYERAMALKSLMISAKGEGLRLAMPLGGTVQAGGAGTVDGSGAAGTSLPVTGLTPGVMIRRGYWVTVIDADGNHCLHEVSEPVAAVTDNTAQVSTVADLKGFGAAMLALAIGALFDADATFTVLIEDSDDNSTFAAVADAYLNGTEALASFQFDDDNEVRKIGYTGIKRYLRATVTPANNTGNLFMSGMWVLGNASRAPTANPPA